MLTMLKSALIAFVLVVGVPKGVYAEPPFIPQTVTLIDGTREPPSGQVSLLVNLSSQNSAPADNVSIGVIAVCSDIACYKVARPALAARLFDTRQGQSELLVRLSIPYMTVRSIHFEKSPALNNLSGDIILREPLHLASPVMGGEVLIVVEKVGGNVSPEYVPVQAVGMLHSPERKSIYYNPKFSTRATLKFGTSVVIPAGATDGPQIFSFAVHDTGSRHPLIDIYPIIELRKLATLSSIGITRSGTHGMLNEGVSSSQTEPVKSSFSKTGVIRFADRSSSETTISNRDQTTPLAATDTCVQRIQAKRSEINSSLSATGTSYLQGCEDVPPYVHIAVTNNNDARVEIDIAHGIGGGSYHEQPLTRIESLATFGGKRPQVVINGFTWKGDKGTGPNEWGCALGFVQNSGFPLGNNMVDGCYSGGVYAENKLAVRVRPRVAASWKEGSTTPLWTDNAPYPYAIVSSSTNIVKNGNCSSDTSTDRWSAFGTTTDNRLIFLSSTSSSATNANSLCSVFKALGANYAIRLDGSSAAGMTIDTFRKNPLVGSSSFIYGSSRYIAYALRVFDNKAGSGTTPVVNINPRPGVPPNPCAVDPRICQ